MGGSRSQTWHLEPAKRIVVCNLKGNKLAAVQGIYASQRDGGDDGAVEGTPNGLWREVGRKHLEREEHSSYWRTERDRNPCQSRARAHAHGVFPPFLQNLLIFICADIRLFCQREHKIPLCLVVLLTPPPRKKGRRKEKSLRFYSWMRICAIHGCEFCTIRW
jgi:hypothetical protein